MEKLIISAPFGNYLQFPGTTPTLGTFTLKYRGGLAYRLWRCLRTLRYNWRAQSWINKLGLPNPGIGSLPFDDYSDKIISIYGFSRGEWDGLAAKLIHRWNVTYGLHRLMVVEFNLSCPNVSHKVLLDEVSGAISRLLPLVTVVAKLPPVRWMDLAIPLYDLGVRHFHACNTIPTPGGGLSGKPLKQYSLWAVDDLKQRWGESVRVIGGGGITSLTDIKDYERAGADHFTVASMLLNPFNWRKVRGFVEYLKKEEPCLIGGRP